MNGLVNRGFLRRDISPRAFHPDDSFCHRAFLFQSSNTDPDKTRRCGRCNSIAMGHQEGVALVLWQARTGEIINGMSIAVATSLVPIIELDVSVPATHWSVISKNKIQCTPVDDVIKLSLIHI